MSVRIVDESKFPDVMAEIEKLDEKHMQVGIFGDEDSFLAKIARVHEYGMTIYPKNAKALAIPLPAAGDTRPVDWGDELFIPHGTHLLARKTTDGFEPLFVLMKSVDIPERSFVRSTFDEKQKKWELKFEFLIGVMIDLQMTAEEVLDALGIEASGDVQRKMTDLQTPPNAPITVANKGSSNPLIDTGRMRQAVTWRVVE